MTITVLGGGNGAFATAAHLALKGFRVNLYEVPEFEVNIAPIRERGGIDLKCDTISDFPTGFARLGTVTTDPEEALTGSEVIWAPLPAFAQSQFAASCAPYLKPEQIVVLTPGNFGGAIEFARILRDRGVRELPKIVEGETMIYAARKENPTTIHISGFKYGMGVAAFPGTDTPAVLPRLQRCYPDLVGLGSILETALRNPNTVVHVPILLLNAPRVQWGKERFMFYWDGCSPVAGKIIEAVDRERLTIGAGLGLQLPPMRDLIIRWYGPHHGASGSTLSEVMSTNTAYENIAAPQTVNHRYFTEDIPYGMIPWETLGAFVGVPTPIISSVINLAQEILGVDFRREARDLKQLGLNKLGLTELKEYVEQGVASNRSDRPHGTMTGM